MAQQTIGLGTSANDGQGDSLRVAGGKINDNFTEIYTAAYPSGGATANRVYAGPGSGAAAAPSFRALVAADLPTLSLSTFTAPTADVAWGSYKITGLADPSAAQDAATKIYVDTVAQGLDAKASVKCATTADITLSGEQTLDGVTTSTSRVLVKSQSTASQNGIYVSSAGSWTRSTDMDNWTEVPGAFVFVEEGTTNGNTGWTCTSDAGGTIGSTSMVWAQFSGAGTYTAGSGLTLTGAQFSIAAGAITNAMLAGSIDLAAKVTGNLAVARLNGGTGASSSTFWRGDGTWASASSSPGGSSGQVQYNNTGAFGGVTGLTLTTGTLSSMAITAGTLNGTVLDITQTFGGTGTYTGILYNITNSGPANVASSFVNCQIAGTSKFKVQIDGSIFLGTASTGVTTGSGIAALSTADVSIYTAATRRFAFSGTSLVFLASSPKVSLQSDSAPTLAFGASEDIIVTRDAAGIMGLRGSSTTTPGAMSLYTYGASPPAAPGASIVRLYADTSGGKIRLMAIFPSGSAQQIAIEP